MEDLNFTNFLSDRGMGGAIVIAATVIAVFANLFLEIYFRKIAAFAFCRLSRRRQLLLLSQSCLKQLLPESPTDKFH